MKKIKHILDNNDKSILENHFIFNKINSNKNFELWASNIIEHYSEKPFYFSNQSRLKDYSINLIWNESINESLVMHIFSSEKFSISNSKMKSIELFNGDINLLDINNENALMKLAKNKSSLNSFKVIFKGQEIGFDLNHVNNEQECVHSLVLLNMINNFYKESSLEKYLNGFDFFIRLDLFYSVIDHWEEKLKKKHTEIDQKIINRGYILAECFKNESIELKKIEGNKWNYESLDLEMINLEKKMLNIKLENDLQINEKKIKKTKI